MELNFETFLKLIPAAFLIWGMIVLIKGQKFEDGKEIHRGLVIFIPVIMIFFFVFLINKSVMILPNQPEFSINLFFFVCISILTVLTFVGIASYYISKDVPEVVSRAGIAISGFALVIFVISATMSQKEGVIRLNNVKGHEFKMVDDGLSAL